MRHMRPLLSLSIAVQIFCSVILASSPSGGLNIADSTQESESAGCFINLQYCSINDLYDSTSFGQSMMWFNDVSCTLITISLVIYEPASVTPNQGGVYGYVWSDDGFGRPGEVIFSRFVPHDAIVYYPYTTDITFYQCGQSLLQYGNYHTGFIPAQSGDIYAGLVDSESCGGLSSSNIFIDGTWRDIASVFGGSDRNWVHEVKICYRNTSCGYLLSTWGDCKQCYHQATTANAKAMRITIPEIGPCNAWGPVSGFWLESVQLMLDSSQSGSQIGTGGIDVKVWADSLGLPGAELASVYVPHEQCRFDPQLTTVSFAGMCHLNFRRSSDIHIGFEVSVPESDIYPICSDDGTHGVFRASERIAGTWVSSKDLYSPLEPNWMIMADIGAMKCGNANQEYAGMINVSDVVSLVGYIFNSSSAICHWYYLDADCNGFVTISDVVYLINFIFGGGPAPCEVCQ